VLRGVVEVRMIHHRRSAHVKAFEAATKLAPVYIGRAVEKRGEIALFISLFLRTWVLLSYPEQSNLARGDWHDVL
jgi:hypothetical protein